MIPSTYHVFRTIGGCASATWGNNTKKRKLEASGNRGSETEKRNKFPGHWWREVPGQQLPCRLVEKLVQRKRLEGSRWNNRYVGMPSTHLEESLGTN